MLQVAQDYRTGTVKTIDVPPPVRRPGGVLVQTVASLISTGTERGKVGLARKSLLTKARQRPDAVQQVIESVRREGVKGAYRRVTHKLDQLSPLGYSAAGTVIDVGDGVNDIRVGDHVAVGGGGYANHAEIVWVPRNLIARIPDGVGFDAAAFATVASIALHGLRIGAPGLGETVGVVGLGLIGQLAVRLAVAAGCRVVACDPSDDRAALGALPGVSVGDSETFPNRVQRMSHGVGADVVLVTAASNSSEPLQLAAEVARDRGVLVVVGAVGMDVPRETLYRKEVSLVVSRSYGPGRYDPSYEEGGRDYPVSYVRWTEGRNLGAVLDLLADGRLDLNPLVSRRFPVAKAAEAYEALMSEDPSLVGVLLDYPKRKTAIPPVSMATPASSGRAATVRVGFDQVRLGLIGAGTFAMNVLLPAFKTAGVEFVTVASASGLSARDAVSRHGFHRAVASAEEVITDPEVNAVVIATPHHLHATLTLDAVRAGKAVFVEKPLAIKREEVERLSAELPRDAPIMVGFNRRFSPHVRRLVKWFEGRGGAAVVAIRVNAGAIPATSWIHDPEIGGGRLVGECCHFVDLAAALIGDRPVGVMAAGIGGSDPAATLGDNLSITMDFPDGSIATVLYTSKGDSSFGKERVEMFADGAVGIIESFDRVELYRRGQRTTHRARGAKGHREEVDAFVSALRTGGPMPIRMEDLLATTVTTLRASELLSSGEGRVNMGW